MTSPIQTAYRVDGPPYDGGQLTTHWPRRFAGLESDALAAWRGPARVPTTALVDLVDRDAGAVIVAAEMLHLVGVFFGRGLPEMVLRQRLYVARTADELRRRGTAVDCVGDDLYLHGAPPRKLSVSIATRSPVAGLLHLGINIDPTGAPVPAVGLNELGLEVDDFARSLLELLAAEERAVELAAAKVRAVE